MASLWPSYPELARADALVPVPLHPARLRSRGFDQARILAEAVSRTARLPVLDALHRVEDTPPQAQVKRGKRPGRLKAAFHARSGLRGLTAVLIDDVCTSGGTLEGCGLALREAGATDVRAYVLARA
jgi:ComF family protein